MLTNCCKRLFMKCWRSFRINRQLTQPAWQRWNRKSRYSCAGYASWEHWNWARGSGHIGKSGWFRNWCRGNDFRIVSICFQGAHHFSDNKHNRFRHYWSYDINFTRVLQWKSESPLRSIFDCYTMWLIIRSHAKYKKRKIKIWIWHSYAKRLMKSTGSL